MEASLRIDWPFYNAYDFIIAQSAKSNRDMDRETFDQTIRTFKHRKPFSPFTVALTDGARLEVDHPDGLVFRDGVAAFVGPGGILSIFDYESVTRIIGDLASHSTDATSP